MSPRLLLHVDDSDDELFLFRRAFERSQTPGWQLESVRGGEAAFEYLHRAKEGASALPDLVLIDLKMPGANGFDVLNWLRANVPAIPVAVVSSSELTTDAARARELGAVAYLSKRDTFDGLVNFVRNWNGNGGQSDGV